MRSKIVNFDEKLHISSEYLSFGGIYRLENGFNVVNVHFFGRKRLEVDFFVLLDACISLIAPRPCPKMVFAHTLKIIGHD